MNATNYDMGNCRARISIETSGGEGGVKRTEGVRTARRGRHRVNPGEVASDGGLEPPPADFGAKLALDGHRRNSTGIYTMDLPRCDYEPMADKAFTGRFAFYNGRHSEGRSKAETLAETMRTEKRLILLADANKRGRLRTKTCVRILAAYCDGATCYVEMERA